MPSPMQELAALKAQSKRNSDILSGKSMRSNGTAQDSRTPTTEQVFGRGTQGLAPAVRTGEDPLTSRGFQFQRAIGLRAGLLDADMCKVEIGMHQKLRDKILAAGFTPAQDQVIQNSGGTMFAPLGSDFLGGDGIDDQFRHEIKSMTIAGVDNRDPEELSWLHKKSYQQTEAWRQGKGNPQSWLDETLGGTLVPYPEMGELIQLLRNRDALINAGARVVPLPPSGRLKFPRQTVPTTGYFIGENASITTSQFQTGTLILSAKKCAALVTMPNELIRFASPASEALLRADMTKTLSLTFDYNLLQGAGSDNVPLGLINTPGTATVTPTTVAGNGNTISPQDLYQFLYQVEANNAEFQTWILRPELFYTIVAARAAVYNGSGLAVAGQFIYDQFRSLGTGFEKIILGYKAVTTPQVSQTRTKGNASNLTYIVGGQFDDYIMAMFGTIEFAQAFQGDTMFAQDQTVVRAILTGDGAPRHPGAFAVCDTIFLTTIGN